MRKLLFTAALCLFLVGGAISAGSKAQAFPNECNLCHVCCAVVHIPH